MLCNYEMNACVRAAHQPGQIFGNYVCENDAVVSSIRDRGGLMQNNVLTNINIPTVRIVSR